MNQFTFHFIKQRKWILWEGGGGIHFSYNNDEFILYTG